MRRGRTLGWLGLLLLGLLLPQLGAMAAKDGGVDAPADAAVAGGENAKNAVKTTDGLVGADDPRPAYTAKAAPPLPRFAEDGGAGQRVVVIPIHGTIDLGLPPFVKRALEEAEGASVVIFDVDTFGGRVDAAVQIRDAILATKIPTVAFVNRRAISAGALISLAADHVVFTPGGTMGAATPIQIEGGKATSVGEKMTSYMRSEMRATAEAKQRDGKLAEAMVDADVDVPGYAPKGKLLTLTTTSALKLGMGTAKVEDVQALLSSMGLKSATVVRPRTNWAEKLARFLTDPTLSGLLMSIGMLGLLMELYTPGFGFAGGIGLTCLVLFFGGHMVVNLAGWEEVMLFLVGLTALGVEVFVIPGFGVVGAVGLALIMASLVMAMVGLPISTSWEIGMFGDALATVMIAFTGTLVLGMVLMRYLPKGALARGLVLETTLASGDDMSADGDEDFHAAPSAWAKYLGQRGFARTDLRLSGKAEIDGALVDVVSRMDYIERGERVRVVRVEGVRVVVVRDTVEEAAPTAGLSEETAGPTEETEETIEETKRGDENTDKGDAMSVPRES